MQSKIKADLRDRRKRRVRRKVSGTQERPRLSVFRSLKHICGQVIDDARGVTLVSAWSSEKELVNPQQKQQGKIAVGQAVGELLARRALEKGIRRVVFDRSGYLYHGRVKALAEGARKGGLDF